jgi:hypothetical protein
MPYAYCGNITPFRGKHVDLMKELAERVAGELKLVGSNGIDFLLSDAGLFLLEVNPRFQGTLETVERAYGVNVFTKHVDALSGVLPQPVSAREFAGKAVLFAKKDILVDKHMSDLLFDCYKKGLACDVPQERTSIPKDKPVVTFFAAGATRGETLARLKGITNKMGNVVDCASLFSEH